MDDHDDDEDQPYCPECGQDDQRKIEYLYTSALHDHLKCKSCGHNFTTYRDDDDEEDDDE